MSEDKKVIKRPVLVDDNGNLTKIGTLALGFIFISCFEVACKTFNELIEDDKNE